MNINKLVLKNFRIFRGTHEFDFTGNKLIVIHGPNGHGKSTIFDAISWVLSGKITRYLGSSEHQQFNYIVNNYEFQTGNYETFVEIELKSNKETYKFKRQIKHNNSERIYINEEMHGLKEGQKKLTNLISNRKRGEIFSEQDNINKITDLPSFLSSTTILSQETLEDFVRGQKPTERYTKLERILGLTRYGNDFREYLIDIKKLVEEKRSIFNDKEKSLKQKKEILNAEYKEKFLQNNRIGKISEGDLLKELNNLSSIKMNYLKNFNHSFEKLSETAQEKLVSYNKEINLMINDLKEAQVNFDKQNLLSVNKFEYEMKKDKLDYEISLNEEKFNRREQSIDKAKKRQEGLVQIKELQKEIDKNRMITDSIKIQLQKINFSKENIKQNLKNIYPNSELDQLEEFHEIYKENLKLLEQYENKIENILNEEKIEILEKEKDKIDKIIKSYSTERLEKESHIEILSEKIKKLMNTQEEKGKSHINSMINQIQRLLLNSNNSSCIVCGMNYLNEEELKSSVQKQLNKSLKILTSIETEIQDLELKKSRNIIQLEEIKKKADVEQEKIQDIKTKIIDLRKIMNKNDMLINPEINKLDKDILLKKAKEGINYKEINALKNSSSEEYNTQLANEKKLISELNYLKKEKSLILQINNRYKQYFNNPFGLQTKQDNFNRYITAAQISNNNLQDTMKSVKLQASEEEKKYLFLVALTKNLKKSFQYENILIDGERVDKFIKEKLQELEVFQNKIQKLMYSIASYLNENELITLENEIESLKKELSVVGEVIVRHSRVSKQLEAFSSKHREVQNELLNQYLDELANKINSFYRQISPHAYYNFINLLVNKSELFILLSEEEKDLSSKKEEVLKRNVNASLTFSAAQSTVLAMSIFLALNVSQNWSELNILGIDDPFQNLDDINLYSFIDVLSHLVIEEEKQIFISTHHEDFYKLIASKLSLKESEFCRISFQSYTKETVEISSNNYKLLERVDF